MRVVIAFAGCVSEEAGICNENGIDAFFPVLRKFEPLENLMDKEQAKNNVSTTVEQVFRLLL